MTTTKTLKTSL